MTIKNAVKAFRQSKYGKKHIVKYAPFRDGYILIPAPNEIPILGTGNYYVSANGEVSTFPALFLLDDNVMPKEEDIKRLPIL